MHQQRVNVGLFIGLGCVGGGAEGDKQSLLPISHMATFEISIGPPITERGMLRHGRDVHPTWVSVDNVVATLRVWDSKSTKFDENLASF